MPSKKIPSIKELKDIQGKRVLLRASLNVPIQNGAVHNQFRIMRAIPTINYLKSNGAKVIVIAHIGREKDETLKPVHDVLNTLVDTKWCDSIVGPQVEKAVADLQNGEVLMLENLRSDVREKDNDPDFAKELAGYCDVYVNDAFAASHRTHASLTGIVEHVPAYFGFNFVHEYDELSKAMVPQEPSLFILGGAKFETKMPLIDKYTQEFSHVFIGGALANDIFRAKGYEIGKSLHSDVDLSDNELMQRQNILLPIDVAAKSEHGVRITTPDDVHANESILDAGPKTIEMLEGYIDKAKTILWNGPLGDYEHGFNTETEKLATAIAASAGYAVVGGGDTVASIESLCLQENFGFLSTAGGAMLTFLEYGTLPAISAVIGE